MMKSLPIIFFALLLHSQVGAQEDSELFFQRNSDLKTRQLLRRYLSNIDSAEWKIKDLLARVEADEGANDYESALNKLRIALVLEDYAPANTRTAFDLNRRMGFFVAPVNIRYAEFLLKKATRISYFLGEEGQQPRLELFGAIAGFALKLEKPDSALHYYRQSELETRGRYRVGHASSLNNIGVFYSKTGQRDSAMIYYQKALNSLGSIDANPTLYCSIHDNIAQERERKGDYQTALGVYQFNNNILLQYKRVNRVVVNKMKLLNVWRKLGYKRIDPEIDSLDAFVKVHYNDLISNEKSMLAFYLFAKNYFYETRQAAKAQLYDGLYTVLKDSIDRRDQKKADMIVNTYLNIEAAGFKKGLDWYRNKAETDRLKLEAADQRLRYNRRIALILVVTAVVIFTLMTLYLRKSKQELHTTRRLTAAELRAKEMEARTIQQELELKKKDLTNVVLQNTQLFDHDQKIIGRLSEIAQQKDNVAKALHSLIADMNNKQQTSDQALLIQHNIEQINVAFYEKLAAQFPGLTKSEVELCGYLRINLSNKDIALLKNVEYTTIKVGKTRLRKKLGISLEEDLYRFIQRI